MKHNIKGFKRIDVNKFAWEAVEEHETMHLKLEQFKATSLRLKVNIPSEVFKFSKVKRGLWDFKQAYLNHLKVEKFKAEAVPAETGEAANAIALTADDLPDEGVEAPEHLLNGPTFEDAVGAL